MSGVRPAALLLPRGAGAGGNSAEMLLVFGPRDSQGLDQRSQHSLSSSCVHGARPVTTGRWRILSKHRQARETRAANELLINQMYRCEGLSDRLILKL